MVYSDKASNRLNVRTRPSTSAQSLVKLYAGVQVQLLGDMRGEWTQICVGTGQASITGYVQTKWLRTGSAATKVQSAVQTQILHTATFMEDTPGGADGAILDMPAGMLVQVLGDVGDTAEYSFVLAGGVTGYVRGINWK